MAAIEYPAGLRLLNPEPIEIKMIVDDITATVVLDNPTFMLGYAPVYDRATAKLYYVSGGTVGSWEFSSLGGVSEFDLLDDVDVSGREAADVMLYNKESDKLEAYSSIISSKLESKSKVNISRNGDIQLIIPPDTSILGLRLVSDNGFTNGTINIGTSNEANDIAEVEMVSNSTVTVELKKRWFSKTTDTDIFISGLLSGALSMYLELIEGTFSEVPVDVIKEITSIPIETTILVDADFFTVASSLVPNTLNKLTWERLKILLAEHFGGNQLLQENDKPTLPAESNLNFISNGSEDILENESGVSNKVHLKFKTQEDVRFASAVDTDVVIYDADNDLIIPIGTNINNVITKSVIRGITADKILSTIIPAKSSLLGIRLEANESAVTDTIKLGSTIGGNDIAEVTIDANYDGVLRIKKAWFSNSNNTDIYVSGITAGVLLLQFDILDGIVSDGINDEVRFVQLADVNPNGADNDDIWVYNKTTEKIEPRSTTLFIETMHGVDLNIGTANKQLFTIVPMGYMIKSIVIIETSGNPAGNVGIGTTALGVDVVASTAIGANADLKVAISADYFSNTAHTDLYVNSDAWGTGMINIYFTFTKL